MRIFLYLYFLLLLLLSCNTSKKINVQQTQKDSLYKEEALDLRRMLKETQEYYDKILSDSSGVTIEYQPVYRDTGSTKYFPQYLPGKVIFDNGKLQSAEGQIKSVTISNKRLQEELSLKDQKIDSLTAISNKKDVQLSETTKVKEVVKKSRPPFWLFILVFIGGFAFRHFWSRIFPFKLPWS